MQMEKASGLFFAFLKQNGIVAVVILTVLVVRMLLRNYPKKYSYGLWAVVGIRMVSDLPVTSRFSLFYLLGLIKSRVLPQNAARPKARLTPAHPAAVPAPVSDGAPVTEAGRADVALASALTASQKICALLCVIWLVGMVVFFCYGIYSYFTCRRLVRTAVRFATTEQKAWGMRRQIKIWECDRIPSPFVLGIVRPQIYIPFRMQEEERQYILAHECWHIRRHDPLWKLLAFVLLAVYWWNPLVWVAFFCMARDMEMSCDEAVLVQFGSGIKKDYSASLLAFATKQHPHPFAPIAFGESDAGRRIKNVLQFKKPHVWMAAAATVLLFVVAVACLTNQKPAGDAADFTEAVDSTQVDAKTEADIREWAQAFCDRDGEKIVQMTAKSAQADLEKEKLLWMDGKTPGFGWSSPWPWGAFGSFFGGTGEEMDGYWLHEVNEEEQTAEILYYAQTSDPHVGVWIETIHYTQKNGTFQVTQETIEQFADGADAKTDGIASTETFDTAYAQGISNSQMDYRINGMGEKLNEVMVPAGALLEPTAAARQLLNLSLDEKRVLVEVVSDTGNLDEGVEVQITFLTDGGTRYVRMIRPWGENGIWIPTEDRDSGE